MKTDIRNRADLELLINAFYHKVKSDQVIGFYFSEVVNVNWDSHLPKMYDFLGKYIILFSQFLGEYTFSSWRLFGKSNGEACSNTSKATDESETFQSMDDAFHRNSR